MTRKRAVLAAGIALVCVLAWWLAHDRARDRDDGEPGTASTAETGDATNLRARRSADLRSLPRASIAGKVTASDGSAPIPGATVCGWPRSSELADEDTREPPCSTADENGVYRLVDLVPARYAIGASAASFIPGKYSSDNDDDRIFLRAGEAKTGVDIQLEPGGVEVRGVVRDIGGGPIAGAWVSVMARSSGWSPTRSGDDGTFVTWARPGQVWVSATAEGYAGNSRQALAPGQYVQLLLTPEAVMAGTVIEHGSGKPIARARVEVDGGNWYMGSSAFTDERGAFRITRLDPGRYKPTAESTGGWGEAKDSVLLGLGQTIDDVVIEVHPALVVAGTIQTAERKQTCASGEVELTDRAQSRDYSAATDNGDGRVEFRAVLPGTYDVQVSCDGRVAKAEYKKLVVKDADVLDAVWEVAPGARIRGVVKRTTGEPVAGASVSAGTTGGDPRGQESRDRDMTERDGRFELDGLTAGKYRIYVRAEEYVAPDKPIEVEVTAGGEATVDIVLSSGGTVRGDVVDAAGKPVTSASIVLDGDGQVARGTTRDDGSFEIQGVTPGPYRARARDASGETLRRPGSSDDDFQGQKIAVAVGEVTRVKLVVEARSGVIRGNVVDAAGNPVTDAFVSASRESEAAGASKSWGRRSARWQWSEQPAVTDTDGKFKVADLSPGTYTVSAIRRGGGEAFADEVALGASVTLTIKDVGSIAGTVTAPGGQVPPEFTIGVSDRKSGVNRDEHFFRTGGQWVMNDLPAGTFDVSVRSPAGTAETKGLALAAGEGKAGVVLELVQRATVTGQLVALDNNEPVPGMHVSLNPVGARSYYFGTDGDKQRITDASGRFRIENAPAGRGQLTARPKDWRNDAPFGYVSRLVAVTAGKAVDLGAIKVPRRRLEPKQGEGELGFTLKDWEPDLDPAQRKLEVALVRADGPAARSGLRAGDVITSVDGNDVRGENVYLYRTLAQVPEGETLVFGLARGDTVKITAAKPL